MVGDNDGVGNKNCKEYLKSAVVAAITSNKVAIVALLGAVIVDPAVTAHLCAKM